MIKNHQSCQVSKLVNKNNTKVTDKTNLIKHSNRNMNCLTTLSQKSMNVQISNYESQSVKNMETKTKNFKTFFEQFQIQKNKYQSECNGSVSITLRARQTSQEYEIPKGDTEFNPEVSTSEFEVFKKKKTIILTPRRSKNYRKCQEFKNIQKSNISQQSLISPHNMEYQQQCKKKQEEKVSSSSIKCSKSIKTSEKLSINEQCEQYCLLNQKLRGKNNQLRQQNERITKINTQNKNKIGSLLKQVQSLKSIIVEIVQRGQNNPQQFEETQQYNDHNNLNTQNKFVLIEERKKIAQQIGSKLKMIFGNKIDLMGK